MRNRLLLLALGASSCITATVIDEHARASRIASTAAAWAPATSELLAGGWESETIEGEAAAVVLKIYYHFAADQTYTGAALVLGDANPEFQTLTGSWSLDSGQLRLNQDEPVTAAIDGDRLRLESAGENVVFRRVRFQ